MINTQSKTGKLILCTDERKGKAYLTQKRPLDGVQKRGPTHGTNEMREVKGKTFKHHKTSFRQRLNASLVD